MTTARWQSGDTRVRNREGGWDRARFRKLAHSGVQMDQFPYGTDTPNTGPRSDLQICHVCSRSSWVIGLGVDHEDQYAATRTAQFIGREHALHCHWTDTAIPELRFVVLIDGRGIPPGQWPRHQKIFGADIIASGWIPMPGNLHWSGECYHTPVKRLGLFTVVPWSPGLLAAFAADQDDYKAAGREAGHGSGGGGGGGGQGHDGEVAATVLANILRGMTKEQCYAEWCKIAIPYDPAWPFTRDDFDRHYGDETRGALAKANARRAAERAAYDASRAWLDRVRGGTS
jgi:hypothetical protein